MKPEIESLFHELVDLSERDREVYFAQRQVPPEVRREVEALLRFDGEGSHTLTASVAGSAQRSLELDCAEFTLCGPYRLIRLLGRGGMGSVHLAQRTDGEVEQQVAVKLLRLGRDEPAFRERFLRERQILATLSHPGIARLLDAGHTDEGQPYLALDYVDGVPIDEYCCGLTMPAKLRLFLLVCDGVAYAHRNLIVHRDLKPSNILVDRSGQPKLLDFGIAKILDESRDQTQTGERMLTPEYASPEQVRGIAQTTATDVYSLGALLYRLLTGHSPHNFEGRSGQELSAAICIQEPARASRVNPEIPRDLDFILAKALRKEPDERYSSVDAMADDLRAFLDVRPVRARSGNAWYRTRMFVRRYRIPVAAAALALIGLTGGLSLAIRERAVAERRFQQVRQLSNKFIGLDAEIRGLPGSTAARSLIVAESLQYLTALGAEASGDADLAFEVGNAYLQVARVQGVPTYLNLGQLDLAEQSLKKAIQFVDDALRANPKNRRALITSAEIAHDLMALVDVQNRREEAMRQAGKSVARLDEFFRLGAAGPEEIDSATHIYSDVGVAYTNSNRFDDAIRSTRRAVEVSKSTELARMRRGSAFGVLSISLRRVGDLEGALTAIRESQRLIAGASGSEVLRSFNLANALVREGMVLCSDGDVSMNRPDEALAVYQRALEIDEEVARKDPRDNRSRYLIGVVSLEIGNILRHSDPRKALAVYDHALQRLSETGNNARMQLDSAALLANASYPARWTHQDAEAQRKIEAALRLLKKIEEFPADKIEPLSEVDQSLRAFADHYADTGQIDKAIALYRDVLAKIIAAQPNSKSDLRDAYYLSRNWARLADLLRRAGNATEAASLEARRLDLWRSWDSSHPNNTFVRRQLAELSLN